MQTYQLVYNTRVHTHISGRAHTYTQLTRTHSLTYTCARARTANTYTHYDRQLASNSNTMGGLLVSLQINAANLIGIMYVYLYTYIHTDSAHRHYTYTYYKSVCVV